MEYLRIWIFIWKIFLAIYGSDTLNMCLLFPLVELLTWAVVVCNFLFHCLRVASSAERSYPLWFYTSIALLRVIIDSLRKHLGTIWSLVLITISSRIFHPICHRTDNVWLAFGVRKVGRWKIRWKSGLLCLICSVHKYH